MLYLHAVGHFHPENELDNAFFEALDIGTTDAWIVSRVGIRTRRTVLPLDYLRATKNADPRATDEAALYTNAEIGAAAGRMALERAGISPKDVGMVVAGSSSPTNCVPAEACTVARELGLEVPAFDINSACSTFGSQLHFLSHMATALPDYVLCVVVETMTRVGDYSDRTSCVLWGDCAAAAVVSTKHPGRARLVTSTFGASPQGAMDVVIPRAGHFHQEGSKVHKFAIKRMADLLGDLQRQVGPEAARELVYVGHQANLPMIESVARRCEVAPGRHWFNIDRFGNTAAAGAPSVLSQRWDDIAAGTQVATIVVGSGLSWSSLLLQF
jgi:3-oxoacyl-[acyl-carrier-protein] synthase III